MTHIQVVNAWLTHWEPGLQGIGYLLSDGSRGCREVRSCDPELPEMIANLSYNERQFILSYLEKVERERLNAKKSSPSPIVTAA